MVAIRRSPAKKVIELFGGDDTQRQYEKIKQGEIHIAELQKMTMTQLIDEARKENVSDVAGLKKQDLIFKILKERVKMNGLVRE